MWTRLRRSQLPHNPPSASFGIPVDNLSVNPARSIGPAVFVGGWALGQLWLFIVAPLIGAVGGALLHGYLFTGAARVEPEASAVAAEPA